tara:strand:+ start:209 stop:1096 length:888 start_codon:yes stop_codon:yes gene_type:complete
MKKVQEKGFALVLSLVLLLVMSLMGGSLIVIASGDHKNNNTSDQYQQAFYVAETGLMQGEKWVNDNYLGHWYKVGEVPDYDQMMQNKLPEDETFIPPEEDKDPGAYSKYTADKLEYINAVGSYTPIYTDASGGERASFVRHAHERGPAYNQYKILDQKKTKCMNSFKNIEANKELWVASGYSPKVGSFWDIVGPLVKATYFLEQKDSNMGYSSTEITEIVTKEQQYLQRYTYEFFVVNVGGSAYRGSGSSIAQTSGGAAPQQGTAYKVYACGKFFDQTGNLQIIVPLETMIVMPY